MHPLAGALAARIRHRRDVLPQLRPVALDPSLKAVSGRHDGEDLIHPQRSAPGGRPEQASPGSGRDGAGLQILHCVLFPDPRHDLSVFGADIVAGPAGASAAIVDLAPVDVR